MEGQRSRTAMRWRRLSTISRKTNLGGEVPKKNAVKERVE
jgi:hypothetical protein